MSLGPETEGLIRLALAEDLGSGDVTSEALIPDGVEAQANIIAREPLVVCGHEVAAAVFHAFHAAIVYEPMIPDGAMAETDAVLATLRGPLRGILSAERTALNFLQRLSGIARETHRLVELVAHTGVKLLDSRKTTPGWRELEKYAVRTGGGVNHRQGLFDAFLIKNNHLDALGGDVRRAVAACRAARGTALPVEIEVRNLKELRAALDTDADIIMLDNFTLQGVREALALVETVALSRRPKFEASGGINAETLSAYAETGVDYLSLGMLTHSVKAADISLRYVRE